MHPDDGVIAERYLARLEIESLQPLSDGQLEVQVKSSGLETSLPSLRFQAGRFFPQIAAPSNLLASMDLLNQARYVMEDFLNPEKTGLHGYLQLHRIDQQDSAAEHAEKWSDFDLQAAAEAYRHAYRADPTNPYLAFFLALTLHYQGQTTEAETYFNEALAKSAKFWEDSLRLGGECEWLGLTRWADVFYEQGATRYFQDVPAPPHEVTLIEVLILFLQRQSSVLSKNGEIERAFQLLEFRRQLFPYTEGDNIFSRHYAHTLRQIGRETEAALEEQRIGQAKFLFDDRRLTAFSFIWFLVIGLLLLGIIFLKNEVQQGAEFGVVVIALIVIGGITLMRDMAPLWRAAVLLFLLLAYSGLMAFLRQRLSLRAKSQAEEVKPPISGFWQNVLNFAVSSYLVLLIGLSIMYVLGVQISQSPLGGKVMEVLFILVFIGVYLWRRPATRLKNVKLFVLIWMLVWCYLAWIHYEISIVGIEAAVPLPSMDRGHPAWIAEIDQSVAQAHFRNRDLLYIQALTHQLGQDFEFARQSYTDLADDPRALNNLGTLIAQKDPKNAQIYFENAIKQDPNYAPAFYNLGVLTGDGSKIEQARRGDAWRVSVYQKYAPNKLWIDIPMLSVWSRVTYWSQGGFPAEGFVEIFFDSALRGGIIPYLFSPIYTLS